MASEAEAQERVKFDSVGRNSALPVKIVEVANASERHVHIGALPGTIRMEVGGENLTDVLLAGQERARSDACRRGNLCDHCASARIWRSRGGSESPALPPRAPASRLLRLVLLRDGRVRAQTAELTCLARPVVQRGRTLHLPRSFVYIGLLLAVPSWTRSDQLLHGFEPQATLAHPPSGPSVGHEC